MCAPPFWPCAGPFRTGDECSDTEKGVRNGFIIFLSTPYSVGTTLAVGQCRLTLG